MSNSVNKKNLKKLLEFEKKRAKSKQDNNNTGKPTNGEQSVK